MKKQFAVSKIGKFYAEILLNKKVIILRIDVMFRSLLSKSLNNSVEQLQPFIY